MNELASQSQLSNPTTSTASLLNLKPDPPRLIVLVPDFEPGDFYLTQRIWEIAKSNGLKILLLGLCADVDEESQLRRKLVTMATILKDDTIPTEIKIEHGGNWVSQTKKEWRPGDFIACYTEQQVGLLRQPLSQILNADLRATVYVISEPKPISFPTSGFLRQGAFWAGAIAILTSFFWMEARISQLTHDWAHTVFSYLCVAIEVGLLWAWNSLFS